MCKFELEDLIKYHEIEFDIIDGYYYNEGRNDKLERAPERASHIAVVCALGGGITGALVSNEHASRCFWMVNWLPCAQQRARSSDECLPDQRSTALGRKKS